MSFMFCCCINLTVLPDISKWDISKSNNMSFMFHNCIKLDLTNIPNWNIENINNKSNFHSNNINNNNLNITFYIRFRDSIFRLKCCRDTLFLDFYCKLNNTIREKCHTKFNIEKYYLIFDGYIIDKKSFFSKKISSVFENNKNIIQITRFYKGG